MTRQQQVRAEKLFPFLSQLDEPDKANLFQEATVVSLPTGQMLMQQNQHCQYIPLVLEGCLRVYTLSPNGREMTLFRTGPGETCLLSIACQIKEHDFPALAQVETKSLLLMLPVATYHRYLAQQPAWKDYIILTLYNHLTAAMQTLEAIAFSRTDKRLAGWLLGQAGGGRFVRSTHEQIAIELGTAREVVSRLLGELKYQGVVNLSRGKIEIVQAELLQEIADNDY